MLVYVAVRDLPPAINYLAQDDSTCATSKVVDGRQPPIYITPRISTLTYTVYPDRGAKSIVHVAEAETGEYFTPVDVHQIVAPPLTFTMRHNEDAGREVNSPKEITSAVSQVMLNFITNKTLDSNYVEALSTVLKTAITGGVGLTDGTYIDNIHLVLEVERHKVFNFKLPPGILKGATKLAGVTISGSNLRIEMSDYGKRIIYTDCGDITILCVPGFRLSK